MNTRLHFTKKSQLRCFFLFLSIMGFAAELSATTYYSTAGGTQNLTTLSFWKPTRAGTGTSPASFILGDIFVIQGSGNGGTTPHVIVSSTAWSISGTNSKLQIENGASLQSNVAITLAAATTFQVDNGGTYIHNNTTAASTSIYAGTESFGATSTVELRAWINNTTVISTGVTLPFGNLNINTTALTGAWNQSYSGAVNLCAGNFTLTSSGSGQFRLTGTGTTTIAIAGNFTQAGSTLSVASGNNAAVTLNIGGNFTLNNGTFLLADGNNSVNTVTVTGNTTISSTGTAGIVHTLGGNGNTKGIFQTTDLTANGTSSAMIDFGSTGTGNEFRIKGDFNKSGTGAFYTTSNALTGYFVFNKAGTQTFSYAGTNSNYTNYVVNAGATLQLSTNLTLGTGSNTAPQSGMTVNGTLDMQDKIITDANGAVGTAANRSTFTLASAATIKTAHATGIQGAIVSFGTGKTSFNAGANYEFQGDATGVFVTTTVASGNNVVNNLVINKSTGVTVTTGMNIRVDGNLDFQSGIVTPTGSLTINSTGNTINASSSKYVNGLLSWIFTSATSKPFPVGKGGVYHPVTFQYTSAPGTSTVAVEQIESALTGGTLPANVNLDPNRRWDILETVANGPSYKVTLDPTGFTPTGTVVMVKRDNSTITSNPTTAPNYTNTTAFNTFSGTSIVSSFALGSDCSGASTTANAGADQVSALTCGQNSVTLDGNIPAFGTGAWSIVSGGSGSFSNTNANSPAATFTGTGGNTYNLLWTVNNGVCSATDNVTITFNQAPAITVPPSTPTATCSGTGIQTLSVTATGSGLSYSWRKGGVAVVNDAVISGQGTATLTLTAATSANAGSYDVVVSGTCTPPATSSAVTVTINESPVITLQPATPKTTCSGSAIQTITVTATGAGLSYSWRKGGVAVVDDAVISGQGTSTLTLTGATAANTGSYDVVITGTCSPGVTSDAVTVTVYELPAITVQPVEPAATCSGTGIQSFSVTATGNGLSYSWRKGGIAVVDDAVISGQGTTTLTLTNPTAANAGSYDVVVSGTCTPAATSDPITVTVNAIPSTPGAISGPVDACPFIGSPIPTTYSVAPVPGANSYLWTVPTGTTLVSGQGTNSIDVTFDNSFAQVNSVFTVKSVSIDLCYSPASLLVVAKNIPNIPGTITGPADACPFIGQLTNAVYSIDPVTYASGYTWTVPGGASIVSGQGSTSISVSYTNGFTGGSVQVTANSNCGNRAPKTKSITKILPAVPGAITGPTDACPYIGTLTNVQYSIAAVPNATSYNWTLPANVSLVSGGGTTTINVTFNTGYVTSLIRVRAVANCGTSSDRTLSVAASTYAMPGIISGPTNACAYINLGNEATYTIRKVTNAASYIWNVPAGATIASHPGGAGVNDTIITVSYDNSFVSGTNISVQAAGCVPSAARNLQVLRVAPSTALGLISGSTNACPYMVSATNPAGIPVTYMIRKSSSATSYTWTAPAGATITAHPDGTGINDTTIQITYSAGFSSGAVTVYYTNACGNSPVRSLSVTKLSAGAASNVDIIQTGFCPNREYTYTLAGMPANATSVLWGVPPGGTLVSGQGSTSITVSYPATAVTGNITATPYNNCSNAGTRIVAIKLPACPPGPRPGQAKTLQAIAVPEQVLEVNVFPNPSINDFKLAITPVSREVIIVRVLDLSGRELSRTNVQPYETVSLGNHLKAGAYMIEVRQGKQVKTTRVTKF